MNATLAVFRGQVRDGWRGLLGWSLGIAAVTGLYLPLYPSLQSPALTQLLSSLPKELVRTIGYDQIASGSGYTQATFFGLIGYVLLTIASTSWGTAAIAGAEEHGRLELTLAHGIGRVHYTVASAAALLTKLLLLGCVACALILLLNGPAELELEPAHVIAALAAWIGLGFVSGAAALAAGAGFGRRIWAIGAGAGVAVLGYALNAVGETSTKTEWMWRFSPYHWAFGAQPLSTGADWGGLGALWGLALALIFGAALALTRRDLRGY
ncbi:ABC transporter permease [Leucobacter luti]|uniref:ABC transporter permease n=1 Tax=Leucobacter luti TaxID=340320 RepID=UPI001C68E59B|nr:ABC transporter permease [Leucobacter luti]QYM75734.1 ABC transporter permease [Leucobacter luti]